MALKQKSRGAMSGRFGEFGGRYVPETLMAPLEELELAYAEASSDRSFQRDLRRPAARVRRPPHAPLVRAPPHRRISAAPRVYLKREDLLHTGAHKINNCLGQALLAERMGKRRIIAETGAGQHGVATATVCALIRPRMRRLHGHRGHATARSSTSSA